MQTQSIINKLPEVIKCIIYDHVNVSLNYWVESCSDKFIGNPIDLFKNNFLKNDFYHVNKLTKVKTPLHFIGLNNGVIPPQEILNKLQKYSFSKNIPNLLILPNIKYLNIHSYITKISNYTSVNLFI